MHTERGCHRGEEQRWGRWRGDEREGEKWGQYRREKVIQTSNKDGKTGIISKRWEMREDREGGASGRDRDKGPKREREAAFLHSPQSFLTAPK